MNISITRKDLVLFLKEKLMISRGHLRSSLQSKLHKEALIFYTSFLPEDSKLSQRSWHLIHDVYEQPRCKFCNENVPSFNNNKWDYLDYCSLKCQRNSPTVIANLSKSLQAKYGTDIINPFQSEDVKEKTRSTMIRKYGVEHNSKSSELLQKRQEESMKKWGVLHPIMSTAIKQKAKETFLKRYGVDNFSKTQSFKDKCKATWISHYGVDHPMKDPEHVDKFLQKIHKCKDFVLPSGRVVELMGYEDKALTELLKAYEEDDICITKSEIRECTGIITYTSCTGRRRTYYPDFFIRKTNTVVEVKSTWTYDRCGKLPADQNENFRKKDACLAMGFNFQFMIM